MNTDLPSVPTALPAALRPAVVAIAAASAASSGGALVAAIVLHRPLWLSSTFIFVPGLIALVGMSVTLRRDEQGLFLARLRAGSVAGLLGTAAYDVSRWAIEASGLASTRSFVALPVFGSGLTGLPVSHAASVAAGWAFHLANGVGFAVAFLFVAAGRRLWWGIAWALVLEAAMVTLYPGWLGIDLGTEFLSVSVAGHVAYGVVLGAIAQRSP